MVNVWAVILAAGESRRFGRDKLTVPFGGGFLAEAVLTSVAQARESSVLHDVLVVVRDPRGGVALHAVAQHFRILVNPDAARGMGTSLRAGLAWIEHADPASEGALVLLADQPSVTLDVIRSVISTAAVSRADVVRPRYVGNPQVPGHPVFLRRSAWSLATELEGDDGLRMLIESSAVVTETVTIAGSNPDIDTPKDLEAVQGLIPDA